MRDPTFALMILRALVNVGVACGIISAAVGIKRTARNATGKALFVMLMCTSVEVFIVTGSLFVPEFYRHILAIIGRFIEAGGVAWFMRELSSGK